MNWDEVSKLPDKAKRAAVYRAARDWLDAKRGTFGTAEVAIELFARADAVDDVSRILLRLAVNMFGPRYATHDGERYNRYGREQRRWRWHGQLK